MKILPAVRFILITLLVGAIFFILFSPADSISAQSNKNISIYSDTLSVGWQNWSWGGEVNFDSSDAINGENSIHFLSQPWGGLYLHTENAVDTHNVESLNFTVRSQEAALQLGVIVYDENNSPIGSHYTINDAFADTQQNTKAYAIPMSELVPENRKIKGIAIQEIAGKSVSFYIDDMYVQTSSQTQTPTLTPEQEQGSDQTSGVVYSEGLSSWENWSWSSDVKLDATENAYQGEKAISLTTNEPWAGLYLHSPQALDTTPFHAISLAVYITKPEQKYQILLQDENYQVMSNPVSLAKYGDLTQGKWTQLVIPLEDVGAQGKRIKGIMVQDALGSRQPTVYIDEIKFETATSSPTTPESAPTPQGPKTEKQFLTIAPGSTLPSSQECASLVTRSSWEPRPENKTANNTPGRPDGLSRIDGANAEGNNRFLPRIDGAFTGTTDEIIQWGACKWGFDEDIVRAVAAQESWWRQSTLGDWNGSEYESYGLMQVRRTYHEGTFPFSQQSVPFNVDYALAWRRACYEGYFDWIPEEAKGDEWGCVGLWFSGKWYNGDPNVAYSGSNWYIKKVKEYYDTKPWLSPHFLSR